MGNDVPTFAYGDDTQSLTTAAVRTVTSGYDTHTLTLTLESVGRWPGTITTETSTSACMLAFKPARNK
jgi:hypothetical protein